LGRRVPVRGARALWQETASHRAAASRPDGILAGAPGGVGFGCLLLVGLDPLSVSAIACWCAWLLQLRFPVSAESVTSQAATAPGNHGRSATRCTRPAGRGLR